MTISSLQGLVYPDFARCISAACGFAPPTPNLRRLGGIDFGFRNPFAAVWGHLDAQGVLWITGEHYSRKKPLSYHASHLPRNVEWYADPAGANERAELRCAGFRIRDSSNNSLRPGIAAVSARIDNGRLRVLESACPNLIAEAQLYRYPDDPRERFAENPLNEHNHALSALRYLIATLDTHHMARDPGQPSPSDPSPPSPPKRKPWLRYDNDALWIPLT